MKIIETEYSKESAGHYSPGVIGGNTLYISGQLSIDPKTKQRPESFELEVKQALDNVLHVISVAGLCKEDILMVRAYIPDVKYWDSFNTYYAAWFGEHKPARVVVPSRELHFGCNVEIEAIAEVGGEK